jgi:adenylyltransferase/sulfurtransferase
MYLAAAGVGHLGIVDFDKVDVSNLQRQILHGTRDVGRPKTLSAQERLSDLNPYVTIQTYETRLSTANALEILGPYDVIVDGTDNFSTRYLINDACVLLRKPNIHGSIYRFEGQVSIFSAPGGPCYRCLYPEPPPPSTVPSCAEAGVLGVLPGIIGSIQAAETIKWLLQRGDSLVGRLLFFDALAMRFRELALHRDPHCPRCGERPTLTGLLDEQGTCGDLKATDLPQPMEEVDSTTLREWLASGRTLQILDVREPFEFQDSSLPNARLIPLAEVAQRTHELHPEQDTVVYCRIGVRSAHAITVLRDEGFRGRLFNLRGGIVAWAREGGHEPSPAHG